MPSLSLFNKNGNFHSFLTSSVNCIRVSILFIWRWNLSNHHSSQHSVLCIPNLYGSVKLGSTVNLIREKAQLILAPPVLVIYGQRDEKNPTTRHAPFVAQSLGIWHHQSICTQLYRHTCLVVRSMRIVGTQGFLPGCMECSVSRHYTSADQLVKIIPQRYLMLCLQWGVCTIRLWP